MWGSASDRVNGGPLGLERDGIEAGGRGGENIIYYFINVSERNIMK